MTLIAALEIYGTYFAGGVAVGALAMFVLGK